MAPKNRIIIDTDPGLFRVYFGLAGLSTNTNLGVDDVMALLLALSASPEELEVAMISVTYGNVPLPR